MGKYRAPDPHRGPCFVVHAQLQEGWGGMPAEQAAVGALVGRTFESTQALEAEADRLSSASDPWGPPWVWYIGPDDRLYRYDGAPRIPGRHLTRWAHVSEVGADTPLGKILLRRRRLPAGVLVLA